MTTILNISLSLSGTITPLPASLVTPPLPLLPLRDRESTAHIDEHGHLVKSSPPPDSATEALKGLNKVEKGSADEGSSSQVGGSIPMELDLPTIESLAGLPLSPEKGAEQAQALES
ncbi:hypothetical protein F5879DRAFT_995983 [Lentinula edodes]|nr:hypothetical protein F5879DRAFT_995983 [Lentinula edodes]